MYSSDPNNTVTILLSLARLITTDLERILTMKRISLITILLTMFSFAAAAKDAAKMDTSKMNPTKATANAVFMEAKDIKWEAVAEHPGLYMAVVEGDSTKGAHHSFMKFDAGFSAPMHHHTPDTFVTVIKGDFVLTVDGIEHRLSPGSFFSFKKKQPHATMCATGSECIIFVDARGKWDTVLEKKLVTN